MRTLVAWRLLAHDKGRNGLAIGGILVAILLIFLQLGFYMAVPKGGLLFYDAMRFDLMMTSSAYVFQAQSSTFPRSRLFQAIALPEVMRGTALYHDSGRWLNDHGKLARDVFVMGINPDFPIFDLPEFTDQLAVLRQPDTILVDAASREEFGDLSAGRFVEIEQRRLKIGGVYHLGTGFIGLGVALTSDVNFVRIFANRNLSQVSLGLLTLKPGVAPDFAAARLREILPADTQVFTRDELTDHETGHWVSRTSTVLIFGFGVIVAIVVGLVIFNQTLSTQIARQLPQYATLKAMGYTNLYLGSIVVTLAIMLSTISYIPAAGISVAIYRIVQRVTLLPIEMTPARMIFVLVIAWGMSIFSALFALRTMRRADPVDLF